MPNRRRFQHCNEVIRPLIVFLTICVTQFLTVSGQVTPTSPVKADPLKDLKFRLIGPFRGGRVGAVEGVETQPSLYYYGATGGGVWKTTDSGTTWINVSDGYFKTGSVGAIDAADSDPNIVYVGMGEETVRGNVSSGDGVYKTVDGGKTWVNIGLGDTQQISRVRVHPKDPNIVYVAALGHLWGSNEQRGIFRTKDGGKTWEKILFRNAQTGAADLAIDPSDPNTLYASLWQISRKPWRMDSGGDGSGLFKSTNGGDTWTEITRNRGLPSGVIGKIGITVSPVNTNRLWAIIEAKDGGLYRSDDGGETWQRTSDSPNIRQRPWYYNRVYADTQNENTVYVLNVQLQRSIDGGRTFSTIGAPHGDHHDLWISPNDSKRMINGNDGGSNVSVNGGASWTEQDQPTAQFYRVSTDNAFPYNIYGAQQDNSTVKIKSRSDGFSITASDWYAVGGGESGWVAPHPDDPDVVFAGSYDGLLTRYDHRTGQERNIDVYPDNPMGSGADGTRYRFQWNFPIIFSPHKTGGKYALYTAANILFRSVDEGHSWQATSPDLTRNDKSKQGSSGGPISQDNTSIEYYDTIFTVDESPVKQGVIWTGSDDGLVQVSRDDGKTWSNVTPKDLPEWVQINQIKASPFEEGTAYFAATNYKNDDQRPYLYKTSDFGRTWTKIVNGIPNDQFTWVVIEDPNKQGFLYAGTERGLFYSANGGESWQSLKLNFPAVPVTDLTVQKRDKDLVVATQGRSFYVLDNLPVLYQLSAAESTADGFLFKPEDAYRTVGGGGGLPPNATVGRNPANGVLVNYFLKEKPKKDLKVEFLDTNGKVIRTFSRKVDPSASAGGGSPAAGPANNDPQPPAEFGLNSFVWNYRMPNAATVPGLIMWGGSLAGPRIVPGNYQVRLTVDGKTIRTEAFALRPDPRLSTTNEDFAKLFELHSKINAKVTEVHHAILEIRDTRTQLDAISRRLNAADQKDLVERAKAISKKLTDVEEALMQTKIKSSQDALNFPIKLNNKMAALGSSIDGSDDAPTTQAYLVFNDLSTQIDAQLAALAAINSVEITNFNKQFTANGLPVIVPQRK